MKPPFLLLLLTLTFFCVPYAAQSRASISFDLRSDSGNASTLDGAARSRLIKSSSLSKVFSAGSVEQRVFALINVERNKNGLPELEWSERLADVARLHSEDMANSKFFSHRGSDGSMVDDRADRLGLGSWRAIGENIAYTRGFDDPAAFAVAKWLESTAHRKNLLGPNWKESAVGVVISEDGSYYFTEVFLLRK
ncbi:MAG: CAP domain-containing protein [Acidobacteriota bacterium]